MLLTLGLGIVLLIPDVGPALIELGGLKVSSFDSYGAYSMKMLVTALFTIGLGLLAHCRVSRTQTDPREHVLVVVSCGAFALMLPWSAGIWHVIPKTEIIQFPWRLCAILTVAAAGLFAVAVNDCLHHGIRGEKRPPPLVMILFALAIIGAGNIVWRVDTWFRSVSTPHVDVMRWVDLMYFTYVSPLELAGFAKRVGIFDDTWNATPTPVEEGVRAEFVRGKGNVWVRRIGPRKLLVSAQVQEDARVEIGQLYFPLWTIVPLAPTRRDFA
jgi:hypothetical protein